MNLKNIFRLIICLFMALALSMPAVTVGQASPSSPIAKGKMKTPSYVYFGKGEMFPVVGLLSLNEEIDVYEYDKDWILTRYDTYAAQGTHTYGHSFYGYVKRGDVLCDPPLEGDASDKADTGPGKRKKRTPKKPGDPGDPDPDDPDATKPEENQVSGPDPISTEDLMEYDWIIRTPGVCQTTVDMGSGTKFVCRFALYAMKFGGYTASSLPVYNDGDSSPYVGYLSYSMKQNMQTYLGENKLGFLEGLGGVSVEAFNNNARFTIDAQADNGTDAIISIMTNRTSVLNPQINDKHMGIQMGGEMFRDQSTAPLDIKLVGGAGGYKLALLNMKPGGGDLIFPVMLEKFPLDDITKAERERLEKEQAEKHREEQRRKAKEEQDKALEEWRKKMNEGMEEQLDGESREGEETDIDLAPLSPEDEEIDLAPLVPEEGGNDGIGSGDNQADLAPLVPLTAGGTREEAAFFPEGEAQ